MAAGFDPNSILQGALGALGGTYGTPMGMFGEQAQYSPAKYFAVEDYFNPGDHFNQDAIFAPDKILKQAAGQ
jgi:hypothetical protein